MNNSNNNNTDNSIYEGIPELFSENNDIHEDNISNDSVHQDNNSNDDFYQDSNYGASDIPLGEESYAFPAQGLFTREVIHETRRLNYEQQVRAHIPQEDLETEGLNYQDLSELMFNTYEDTLDEYEDF